MPSPKNSGFGPMQTINSRHSGRGTVHHIAKSHGNEATLQLLNHFLYFGKNTKSTGR